MTTNIHSKDITTTTTTSSTSSTTTSSTRSQASIDYDLQILADEYTETLNFPPTLAVMHFVRRCLETGMEPAAISHAINETAWARYPSPHYLHAILSRYIREGLLTHAAVILDEQRRQDRHASSRRRMETDLYDGI